MGNETPGAVGIKIKEISGECTTNSSSVQLSDFDAGACTDAGTA